MNTFLIVIASAVLSLPLLAQRPEACPTRNVIAKTANYTALLPDAGSFITMSGTSLTLTLPSTAPAAAPMWCIKVLNLDSTALAISPNGLNINGQSGNWQLGQHGAVSIYSDGSNYFINTADGWINVFTAAQGAGLAASTNFIVCNIGGFINPPSTNADLRSRCYFPSAHLITGMMLVTGVRGTLASTGTFTMNVFKNGSALSPTCTFSAVDLSIAAPTFYTGSAGCVFPVAAQDYIQMNFTTPGWSPNTPTTVDIQLQVKGI